tara:strand:- start:42 stop:527 length:486 start_codon:yes stop_codon:yes gene_type:complete
MRTLIAVVTGLMLLGASATAEDYWDARAAYIEGNYPKAFRLYRQLAEEGDVMAQNSLGWMYANGEGVVEDDAEAVYWYRKAAEQGFAAAFQALGVMYSRGEGVPQNDVQAYAWSNVAAIQGSTIAVHDRALIEKRMTSYQITEGQRLSFEIWEKYVSSNKK